MISKEKAKEAAKVLSDYLGRHIPMSCWLTDPWMVAEQQMIARINGLKEGGGELNAKMWEAGFTLKQYFIQHGLLKAPL